MYIILETHGGPEYAIVVTDEDGCNLVFETKAEAMLEAEDCQDPVIVEV